MKWTSIKEKPDFKKPVFILMKWDKKHPYYSYLTDHDGLPMWYNTSGSEDLLYEDVTHWIYVSEILNLPKK
jgi:hypothetical protein